MGWSVGWDEKWQRDIGYGVPSTCDHPGCTQTIDRGLSYVCGGEPHGGERGCGLYFCSKHMYWGEKKGDPQMCMNCCDGKEPFKSKPDTQEWIDWKLTDESWGPWRMDNPITVAGLLGTRVVHLKKEPFDVYIGRGEKWGSPFGIGTHGTREEVIEMYEE